MYLRDINRAWYCFGIKGFSNNYTETIEIINKYKEEYNFKKLILMGLLSGGYASLYFGTRMNADFIISFSPQIELSRSVNLYGNNFKKYFEIKLDDESKKKFKLQF